MYCNSCNQIITTNGCGCSTALVDPTTIQIDDSQVFYHKGNGELSALTNLGLSNGSTLELALETIDVAVGPLTSVLSTSLAYLRTKYVINNLTQFLVAVNTELNSLNTTVLTGQEWTTVARPSPAIEGTDGYNLTLHSREYWSGSAWVQY